MNLIELKCVKIKSTSTCLYICYINDKKTLLPNKLYVKYNVISYMLY